VGDWPTMNRSYFRVRVRTSISPYRRSSCYKRETSTFQNIHIGPQAGIQKGTKRVYLPLIFRNVSWPYQFIFFLKKKRVPRPGEQIGVGKRERGTTSPLPLLFPGHPSLPSPSPGRVRSDEIRSLERSEVIGREDCWREISIHSILLFV
jgi:hypothetical protein